MALSTRLARGNVGINILTYVGPVVAISKQLARLPLTWVGRHLRGMDGPNEMRSEEMDLWHDELASIREQSVVELPRRGFAREGFIAKWLQALVVPIHVDDAIDQRVWIVQWRGGHEGVCGGYLDRSAA